MMASNPDRILNRVRKGDGRASRMGQPLAVVVALLGIALLFGGRALGGVTASISGTVRDASGGVIPGATVTATHTETGIALTQPTNAQGFYSFQSLPLGRYDIEVRQSGFRIFRQTGLVLNVNAALVVDVALQVGPVQESVTVSSKALHVETANTHMGEVIGAQKVTAVPLVTRSYTDLLALQPGVVATSSGLTGGFANGPGGNTSAGFVLPLVSGDLNAGNLSVNGQRESSNGFLLNGATVQEPTFGGTAVVPSLDSIAEFRILTNNFDAEYGQHGGGQINVITKSGTNQFHGDVFEFLRNTKLNSRNFFDPGRGAFHQNQFGGTIGGPIRHDKTFFFGDYQGNRKVVGVSSGNIGVPSLAERTGDFSGLTSQLTGTVQGPLWAQQLSNELGQTVTPGEHYFFSGCTSTAQCVFPNAQIPTRAFPVPTQNLLKFIPTPNNGTFFSTSGQSLRLRDDKTSGRVDANTRFGMLSGYYFFDDYRLSNPYPTANVPGFSASGTGRTQSINVSDTKTFGNTMVNEFRFEYVRVDDAFNKPQGGTGIKLSDLGFTEGASTLGINALDPSIEGVPEIDFNSFVIGVPSRPIRIVQNTFQWMDNFSKVVGTHTIKLGGSYHYTQDVEILSNVVNGNFVFSGTETGVDFADFLIGAPSQYVQGQALPYNGRNRYGSLYGQDSWRARSNLTVNYGLRWEFSTPWYEKHNEIETLVPGLQSRVFPGSPAGWVFPGDPGIPRGLAPTRYNNFSPRIGIAYSPSADHGLLRRLTGGRDQTSIRAGYGIFFTTFEGATNFNEIGDAPFGFFYVSPVPPSFTTPFLDRGTGKSEQQRFPVQFPPGNISPQNPDNSVNWSLFLPISSSPGFFFDNHLPYAEHYELSLQRQVSKTTLVTLSYVGIQAHRLLSTLESNTGNPALCLSVSQPSQVAPGSPTCSPGGENGVFTTVGGQVINGTRAPFVGANLFTSNGWFITIGNSNYNSLQLNLRHQSGPLELLAGYTYGKALDNASGYGEQINPVNQKLSKSLSAFDVTHNFVISYNYRLPLDRLGGAKRLTNGWQLSGITRFSTGLPVTLIENDDHSLLGTAFTGPFPTAVDTPSVTPGPLNITDPRSAPGHAYFNFSLFSTSPIGQQGNANRRFFHGPGINNFDMAVLKDTRLIERLNLQFRVEFFNIFNHAQFNDPNGNINAGLPNFVNGVNIGGTFGLVQSANPPRIVQMSLKLLF